MLQEDLIYYIPMYVLFLSLCFSKIYPKIVERLMWSLILFLAQYLFSFLFPEVQGYSGYLVFGFVIGNFLGVKHPPSIHEEDIGLKRKVVGWIAIVIFILCFPPQFFVL